MVNKTSLVSLSFFTNIWWITVDMLVLSVVERYFRHGLKCFIPLQKSLTVNIYMKPTSLLANVYK